MLICPLFVLSVLTALFALFALAWRFEPTIVVVLFGVLRFVLAMVGVIMSVLFLKYSNLFAFHFIKYPAVLAWGYDQSFPLKPLNQIKPNLAGMVLGRVPFTIMSDSPALHSRWLLLLKIDISSKFA
jgi:hypothetical protein